jgi:hypothetical protein
MPTSKRSRGEGARYGGLDRSAGSFPAQLRALALGYLFFPHYSAICLTKRRVHIGCCRSVEQAGGNLGNLLQRALGIA